MELFDHMFSSYLSFKGLMQEADVNLTLHLQKETNTCNRSDTVPHETSF